MPRFDRSNPLSGDVMGGADQQGVRAATPDRGLKMTISNSRRTTRRVYRLGLVISAAWLVVTVYWTVTVVRAVAEARTAPTLLDSIRAFDPHATEISYGAVGASLLFMTRVVMFLQWPEARLLWRKWYR